MTVVDAKGWGSSERLDPREGKIELLGALSLFGLGGPHVILLVIPLLDFTESDRRAVERMMEVLTPSVWRHTMVLFTYGDHLRQKGRSVEEHIRLGGDDLHWLMEKCRNKYYVFDNKVAVIGKQGRGEQEVEKPEGTWWMKTRKREGRKSTGGEADGIQEEGQEQVTELLTKVEDMCLENGGWHFSFHMYRRLEEEWNRREQELRARLEAERTTKTDMEPEKEDVEMMMNTEEDKETTVMVRLQRQSSEEDCSSSEGEKEESIEVKTEMMAAPCRCNGGQRLALSSIRRLA